MPHFIKVFRDVEKDSNKVMLLFKCFVYVMGHVDQWQLGTMVAPVPALFVRQELARSQVFVYACEHYFC